MSCQYGFQSGDFGHLVDTATHLIARVEDAGSSELQPVATELRVLRISLASLQAITADFTLLAGQLCARDSQVMQSLFDGVDGALAGIEHYLSGAGSAKGKKSAAGVQGDALSTSRRELHEHVQALNTLIQSTASSQGVAGMEAAVQSIRQAQHEAARDGGENRQSLLFANDFSDGHSDFGASMVPVSSTHTVSSSSSNAHTGGSSRSSASTHATDLADHADHADLPDIRSVQALRAGAVFHRLESPPPYSRVEYGGPDKPAAVFSAPSSGPSRPQHFELMDRRLHTPHHTSPARGVPMVAAAMPTLPPRASRWTSVMRGARPTWLFGLLQLLFAVPSIAVAALLPREYYNADLDHTFSFRAISIIVIAMHAAGLVGFSAWAHVNYLASIPFHRSMAEWLYWGMAGIVALPIMVAAGMALEMANGSDSVNCSGFFLFQQCDTFTHIEDHALRGKLQALGALGFVYCATVFVYSLLVCVKARKTLSGRARDFVEI